MRRWCSSILVLLLVLAVSVTANAAGLQQGTGTVVDKDPLPGIKPVQLPPGKPIAFNVIANRYTDVDPSTTFDLNGDSTGDLMISGSTVTAKNGALVQLIDPPVLSLDDIQTVPTTGYAATAAVQLSRVYLMQLPNSGGYAKFMLLQTAPKVTIRYHFGKPTTSALTADGSTGKAVLTWNAMTDAALGYNVYRYEVLDQNSYTVTLLNDFCMKDLTFTDNTALRHTYLYVVIAMKADGSFGMTTTVAPVAVESVTRSLIIALTGGTAKLDAIPVTVDSPPVIKNGRLMVPASLLKSAGVVVVAESGKITLTRRIDSVTYTMVLNFDIPDYTWNGSSYKADVPPYMAGSVAMVPLRVVAPGLGFGLTYNSASMTALLQWYE